MAQNPKDFEDIDELDENDKETIHYEYTHKWSHPMTLYITIILCSLGAATQSVLLTKFPPLE